MLCFKTCGEAMHVRLNTFGGDWILKSVRLCHISCDAIEQLNRCQQRTPTVGSVQVSEYAVDVGPYFGVRSIRHLCTDVPDVQLIALRSACVPLDHL